MHTRITELLGIEFPLIQGGLGGLAFAELCGAVSAAGAFGQITPQYRDPAEALAKEIDGVRAITDKPFGINCPVFAADPSEHLEVAIGKGCAAITVTGGNPLPVIERVAGRVPIIALTSTVRQAVKAEEAGADAVIVVGQEGGGNIGRVDTGTIALTPQVVDAVKIPVIAAGGLADGRGMLAGLALGAEGVMMGTRFVAVRECPADDEWKQALVEVEDLGTAVVSVRERMRTRVLAADREAIEAAAKDPSGARPRSRGAGQGSGLIHDVPTVKELIERLRREVEEGHARIGRMF